MGIHEGTIHFDNLYGISRVATSESAWNKLLRNSGTVSRWGVKVFLISLHGISIQNLSPPKGNNVRANAQPGVRCAGLGKHRQGARRLTTGALQKTHLTKHSHAGSLFPALRGILLQKLLRNRSLPETLDYGSMASAYPPKDPQEL